MAVAGDRSVIVDWRLAVLAMVALRQSGDRSTRGAFTAHPAVMAGADGVWRGGYRSGGAGSPPADAGVYRYSSQGRRLLITLFHSPGSYRPDKALIPSNAEALACPLSNSVVFPCHAIRPSATTMARDAIRAASSTLCETINSVSCRSRQISLTNVSISWRSAGSSAEKGSSSSSTGCSRTRQRASATR
nr:Uncharacterised protein [Salmonella sp. NCTC 7297]